MLATHPTPNSQAHPVWFLGRLALLAALAVGIAGCGDDSPSASRSKPKAEEEQENDKMPQAGADDESPSLSRLFGRARNVLVDTQAINTLCQQSRATWLERRFADPVAPAWEDQFVFLGVDPETDHPDIMTWPTLLAKTRSLENAFDKIEPHPKQPRCDIQGPLAVIRLPLAICHAGGQKFPIDNLIVATRHDGVWRTALAMNGDWKLTEQDRFDPDNPSHRAIQEWFDRLSEYYIAENANPELAGMHPLYRPILPHPDQPETAVIGNPELTISFFRDIWREHEVRYHRNRVLHVKTQGQYSLMLLENSQVLDDGPKETSGGLVAIVRDGATWKCCLWVVGDWSKVMLGE